MSATGEEAARRRPLLILIAVECTSLHHAVKILDVKGSERLLDGLTRPFTDRARVSTNSAELLCCLCTTSSDCLKDDGAIGGDGVGGDFGGVTLGSGAMVGAGGVGEGGDKGGEDGGSDGSGDEGDGSTGVDSAGGGGLGDGGGIDSIALVGAMKSSGSDRG